jgi:DNA polymerase-4
VELLERPELRGKPVIVGPRDPDFRGVVMTASYEARRFGVGSAMPISQAWKACPHGIYVRPDMEKYARVSGQVMEVLGRFTDCVEPISIDEAFLDVTGSRRVFGTGERIAHDLKAAIAGELGLTASVGVAPSKLVAKIASDLRKPDGLVVVPPGTEAEFLAPLPVRRLWGVGPKMEEQLVRLGVHTIGQLAALDPERLERRLGTHGHDLLALARGCDDRPVVAHAEGAKSVGHEHTFDADTADRALLRQTLLDLADSVARRLRAHGYQARTVTLKYRDETFHTVTRAETMPARTDAGATLFAVTWRLFEKVHGRRKVRLIGLSASGLAPPPQMGLFAEAPTAADRVRDAVEGRFGEGALTRASLLPSRSGGPGAWPGSATRDRKGSRRLRR